MPLIGQKQKVTLDYLSLNTMPDSKFPINETLLPFVSFGARLDFLISNSTNFNWLKDTKELNKLSYGINIGAGIKYQFLQFQISTRGDYLLNLNNVSDYNETKGSQVERIQLKAKTFLANLFFNFKLK